MALCVIGMLLFLGSIGWLVVALIKESSKKYSVIGVVAGVVLVIIDAPITPPEPEEYKPPHDYLHAYTDPPGRKIEPPISIKYISDAIHKTKEYHKELISMYNYVKKKGLSPEVESKTPGILKRVETQDTTTWDGWSNKWNQKRRNLRDQLLEECEKKEKKAPLLSENTRILAAAHVTMALQDLGVIWREYCKLLDREKVYIDYLQNLEHFQNSIGENLITADSLLKIVTKGEKEKG